MDDDEKQLDELVHNLREGAFAADLAKIAYMQTAANAIEKLRIENQVFWNAWDILAGKNEKLYEENEKLREENDTFTEIAFDLACVDDNHRTEHDDLLIEDAFSRAKAWYKENKE